MDVKKVIDGDNGLLLEKFDPMFTESIIKKYKDMDQWDDVEVDYDGDIICQNDMD